MIMINPKELDLDLYIPLNDKYRTPLIKFHKFSPDLTDLKITKEEQLKNALLKNEQTKIKNAKNYYESAHLAIQEFKSLLARIIKQNDFANREAKEQAEIDSYNYTMLALSSSTVKNYHRTLAQLHPKNPKPDFYLPHIKQIQKILQTLRDLRSKYLCMFQSGIIFQDIGTNEILFKILELKSYDKFLKKYIVSDDDEYSSSNKFSDYISKMIDFEVSLHEIPLREYAQQFVEDNQRLRLQREAAVAERKRYNEEQQKLRAKVQDRARQQAVELAAEHVPQNRPAILTAFVEGTNNNPRADNRAVTNSISCVIL